MGPQKVSAKSATTEPNPFACFTPEELERQIQQLAGELGYTLVTKLSTQAAIENRVGFMPARI
jgi:hypothetical protein